MNSSRFSPVLACCLVATWLTGCSEPAEEPIASTAQEIRAGTGTQGQVYLGVDLLVTDDARRGIPCGQGNVEVEFETSRNGIDGPWLAANQQTITLSCNDHRGALAMVLDNSGSLDGQLDLLKQGVSSVAERLLDGGGSMSVVRVSTDSTVLVPLSKSDAELATAIDSLKIRNGWTALWDGVRLANETLGASVPASRHETQPNVASFCATAQKHAILLFTDGKENNSSNQKLWSTTYPGDGLDTQLADIESLRVNGVTTPVYAIGLGRQVDEAALQSLARATGGRYIGIDSADEIPRILELMAEYFVTTHRACIEVPSHQCGPLDVRVTYRYRVNGSEVSDVKMEHLHVPCDTRSSGRVATMLLALTYGETARTTVDTLVANTVNFVSPIEAPRVLFVRDDYHHEEHDSDTASLHQGLLDAGYLTDFLEEPPGGLDDANLRGYDVVWFSNPGYPIDDEGTVAALRQFSANGGGVVLQGDDMASVYGNAFPMSDLTRLVPIDNGVKYCGKTIDGGRGGRYRVTMDPIEHPILRGLEKVSFLYGDDIDTASLLEPTTTVLAWATVEGAKGCSRKPVITVFSPPNAQ